MGWCIAINWSAQCRYNNYRNGFDPNLQTYISIFSSDLQRSIGHIDIDICILGSNPLLRLHFLHHCRHILWSKKPRHDYQCDALQQILVPGSLVDKASRWAHEDRDDVRTFSICHWWTETLKSKFSDEVSLLNLIMVKNMQANLERLGTVGAFFSWILQSKNELYSYPILPFNCFDFKTLVSLW